MKTLAILGAGTAGTIVANRAVRNLDGKSWRVIVIDKDERHVYQPGLLLVPFGTYAPNDLVRPRKRFLPREAELIVDGLKSVDSKARKIELESGTTITYDLLVVATGADLAPEATDGLTGPGYYENAFDFYTLEGASQLAHKLSDFEGGRIAIHTVDMPIKCPVAPLEFAFLADAFFSKRGQRDDIELIYVTPLDGAFSKPKASAMLGHLLESRRVNVEPNFGVDKVDGEKGQLLGMDGRTIDYDLLVTIPLHEGTKALRDSALTDEMGFVRVDPGTLQSKESDHVFALGDACDVPASKAGSVAHFQAEVLEQNLMDVVSGRSPSARFDGHANCFIETGHEKALLIDFNYDTEPLPGRFPLPGVGPFTLLEESAVNHWGKLAFRWVYWNLLLKGKDLPIEHSMTMAGKWSQ